MLWIIYEKIKKERVLDMNDYEINVQTLAIIPLKEGKSRVIEENNSYIVNKTPM